MAISGRRVSGVEEMCFKRNCEGNQGGRITDGRNSNFRTIPEDHPPRKVSFRSDDVGGLE